MGLPYHNKGSNTYVECLLQYWEYSECLMIFCSRISWKCQSILSAEVNSVTLTRKHQKAQIIVVSRNRCPGFLEIQQGTTTKGFPKFPISCTVWWCLGTGNFLSNMRWQIIVMETYLTRTSRALNHESAIDVLDRNLSQHSNPEGHNRDRSPETNNLISKSTSCVKNVTNLALDTSELTEEALQL